MPFCLVWENGMTLTVTFRDLWTSYVCIYGNDDGGKDD